MLIGFAVLVVIGNLGLKTQALVLDRIMVILECIDTQLLKISYYRRHGIYRLSYGQHSRILYTTLVGMTYVVVAYVVAAYIVVAYVVMAYIVIAYTGMPYVSMAYVGMACVNMAYIVMAHIVIADLKTSDSMFCVEQKCRLRSAGTPCPHTCIYTCLHTCL